MEVIKAVNRSARNAQYVAGTNLCLLSIYGKCHHSMKSVDCLLIAVMRVRHWDLGTSGHVKLEHRQRAASGFPFEQEPYGQLPDPDFFPDFAHCSILFLPTLTVAAPAVRHISLFDGRRKVAMDARHDTIASNIVVKCYDGKTRSSIDSEF